MASARSIVTGVGRVTTLSGWSVSTTAGQKLPAPAGTVHALEERVVGGLDFFLGLLMTLGLGNRRPVAESLGLVANARVSFPNDKLNFDFGVGARVAVAVDQCTGQLPARPPHQRLLPSAVAPIPGGRH